MTPSTYSIANLSDWVGKELGTSNWVTVGQDRINEFAHCTGDHQWIHVDVERAHRESPFGGPVAHGYLTLALLADMSMDVGVVPQDAVAAFNYGLDKVRFMTPVKAGARVRTRITLAEVTAKEGGRKLVKLVNTVEIEGEAKPALIAETLAMLVGAT
ncbi:MaoC family dehydratase [Piscinibacter sp. XHJ-5]|uniref:MaoC family dehydratase n=1 Tax=Piscinibacter sp. XHJ-5 TaxID=3037797 RepID=UPI00245292A6|nr:MaoC family dehydratase [Piscinibacter sp. XHJ-5]